MFTGIIEHAGRVTRIDLHPGGADGAGGARLTLDAGPVAVGARLGDSVAVNGVCLTVVEQQGEELSFDAVPETLRRSSLGSLRIGDRVNLERPLRADGRFDGHIVQGHVDGTAVVAEIRPEGNARRLRFGADRRLLRYVVEKGSIAVDGISLTVAAVGEEWFEVVVIPHTWEVTNLSERAPGAIINLEVDLLAKYVERLLAAREPGERE